MQFVIGRLYPKASSFYLWDGSEPDTLSNSEWGAVALGCLDIGIQALACSPSNLTSRGR